MVSVTRSMSVPIFRVDPYAPVRGQRMARAKRKQIVLLTAAKVFWSKAKFEHKGPLSHNARSAWGRINKRLESMCSEFQWMDSRDYREIAEQATMAWQGAGGPHMGLDHINHKAAIEALLYMLTVMWEEMPVKAPIRKEWGKLVSAWFTLVKHLDPEWEDPTGRNQEKGVWVGQGILARMQ